MDNKELEVVEKIRNKYTQKESNPTKFEQLKALDKKVKTPAIVFAYIFGIIGSLILGTGMCLAMKVIGDLMILGIIIGVIGILMVSTNYVIYKNILKNRREKYAEEILSKSEELLNN